MNLKLKTNFIRNCIKSDKDDKKELVALVKIRSSMGFSKIKILLSTGNLHGIQFRQHFGRSEITNSIIIPDDVV